MNGPPDGPAVIAAIIAAGAVLGAIALIARYVVRPVAKAVRILIQIGGDWFGHPARPGVEAVPGVMEQLAQVRHEVRHNDGTSLKDSVVRIEAGQTTAKEAAEVARDLAAEVHDEFHHWIADAAIREETYRAALAEVGIAVEDPPPRDPNTRTRRTDTEGDG